jgi:hypothetical protein
VSFHGLRHCAASLPACGAEIAVVSKLLGHASIAITADMYGHLVGTIAQKAVNGATNLIAHTEHTHQVVDASCGFHPWRVEALRLGQIAVVLAWRNR